MIIGGNLELRIVFSCQSPVVSCQVKTRAKNCGYKYTPGILLRRGFGGQAGGGVNQNILGAGCVSFLRLLFFRRRFKIQRRNLNLY